MERAKLVRRLAVAGCAINAVLLLLVQLAGPTKPPFWLFLIFFGVWAFGAIMLELMPKLGTVGTAVYGVVLGLDLISMHGASNLNIGLALSALATAGLSVIAAPEAWRRAA